MLLVNFDVERSWTLRFKLLTVQLLTICLLFVAVVSIRIWPPPDLSHAHYDQLYSLAMLKWERRRGATAKSDDILSMLEEETEALIANGYRDTRRAIGRDERAVVAAEDEQVQREAPRQHFISPHPDLDFLIFVLAPRDLARVACTNESQSLE